MSDITEDYVVLAHDLPKFERGELPSYSALRRMIRDNSELSEMDRCNRRCWFSEFVWNPENFDPESETPRDFERRSEKYEEYQKALYS